MYLFAHQLFFLFAMKTGRYTVCSFAVGKQCFGSGQVQTGSLVFEKPDPDLGSWVPNPDLSNVYFIYQLRLSIQLSYVDS